jgi:hypothetical protein
VKHSTQTKVPVERTIEVTSIKNYNVATLLAILAIAAVLCYGSVIIGSGQYFAKINAVIPLKTSGITASHRVALRRYFKASKKAQIIASYIFSLSCKKIIFGFLDCTTLNMKCI